MALKTPRAAARPGNQVGHIFYAHVIYDDFTIFPAAISRSIHTAGSRNERHLSGSMDPARPLSGFSWDTFPLWHNERGVQHRYESANRSGIIYTEIYIIIRFHLFRIAKQAFAYIRRRHHVAGAGTSGRPWPEKRPDTPGNGGPSSCALAKPRNADRHAGRTGVPMSVSLRCGRDRSEPAQSCRS